MAVDSFGSKNYFENEYNLEYENNEESYENDCSDENENNNDLYFLSLRTIQT